MKEIYLDYAAATPVDPAVLKAMEPYQAQQFYNPSSVYLKGREVAVVVENARRAVAKWLGARPGEIVFTAGGTESTNLAIHGVMQAWPKANVIVSAVEHEAVLEPAKNYRRKLAPVKPDGVIDLTKLAKLIDDSSVLISVMYANNEIGTIQPIREISRLIEEIKHTRRKKGNTTPLYLHTDACQAPAYLDLHVARLGVDLMTLNAGKIYGPKQCGALYVKAGTGLTPRQEGGGQERGLRSGTENVAGIIGFALALELVQSRRKQETARLEKLRGLFMDQVKKQLPAAVINGPRSTHRLPNNVHLTLPGTDNERLMMELDERGILVSTGSACSAARGSASHVLLAIGCSASAARSSLRFTMGKGTSEEDIRTTVKTLQHLTAKRP